MGKALALHAPDLNSTPGTPYGRFTEPRQESVPNTQKQNKKNLRMGLVLVPALAPGTSEFFAFIKFSLSFCKCTGHADGRPQCNAAKPCKVLSVTFVAHFRIRSTLAAQRHPGLTPPKERGA